QITSYKNTTTSPATNTALHGASPANVCFWPNPIAHLPACGAIQKGPHPALPEVGEGEETHGAASREEIDCRHEPFAIHPLQAPPGSPPAAPLPGGPGAHPGAEPHHAARAVRRAHRDPLCDRGQARIVARRDRVRGRARRHRRQGGAAPHGYLALRRG